MRFLRFFSPTVAWHDLRAFLSARQKHEWWFLLLATVIPGLILAAFVKDSYFERTYKREIVYMESWRLDRSEDEIKTRQAELQAIRDQRAAELKARQDKRQAEFKRLDDKLRSWGI